VRGSTPAAGPEFVRYGGNTSCIAIARAGEPAPSLVLDGGTGLRDLTTLLVEAPFAGTILLSHLHWDHVQGLPFFRAGDRDDAEVRLLLPVERPGTNPEELLARVMSPPFFPIRPRQLRGRWTFGAVVAGRTEVDGYEVTARQVPHKGGLTFGYRVSADGGAVAYVPDHCPTALGRGPDGLGEYHQAVVELAAGADVLVHDAYFLAEELDVDASLGHAAAEYAVGLGRLCGVKSVVLFHHAPERDDADLDRIADRFKGSSPAVRVAASGTTIDVSAAEW
jgi:ribonuclease BN (tRNA processing enzyme)